MAMGKTPPLTDAEDTHTITRMSVREKPVVALPEDQAAAAAPTSARAAPAAAAIGDDPGRIEIVLPDGVTVRVGAAVDEVALHRVLVALGRR